MGARWGGVGAMVCVLGLAGPWLSGCAPKYAELPAIAPTELWAPLPVQHVDVGGVDVAYSDSGGEGEPVVFIHGLSSYMGFWEYQLPQLAETHRVLALDLPGFGASGRPDAPYDPPWFAEVVAAWMTELGVERATVVGHSLGGQVALTLALEQPERVEALVLAAPAGIERFSRGHADWMRAYWTESRTLEAREQEVRTAFTTLVFNRRDGGVERLIRERVTLGKHPSFRGTSVAVSRAIAGMLDHPVRDRLGEVTQPTLLVFGSRDAMIPNPIFNGGTTRSVAQEGVEALPNAELVWLKGAGHTVQHDDPEGFNAALERFLAR